MRFMYASSIIVHRKTQSHRAFPLIGSHAKIARHFSFSRVNKGQDMHGKRWEQWAIGMTIAAVVSCLAVPQPVQPVISSIPVAHPAPKSQVWNLKNADIRAVIQTIAVLTGKNFLIDPRVNGNVTLISQNPMTPDELYQVFLSMLHTLQLAAIPNGHVIKVVPSMDANALSRQIATANNPGYGDETVVRVVPVNNVSATELVPVLRPLMSQSGSVTAYMPSNSLILSGSAANITRLVNITRQMDAADANQVAVVRLRYASAKKITSVISALQSASASQGKTSNVALAADEDDNSILVSGNLVNQVQMERLIHQLDKKGSSGDDTTVLTLNYLSAKKLAPILTKIAQGINASDAKTGVKEKATTTDTSDNSNVSIQAEEATNAIIMHAPKIVLNNLMRVVHRLDARPEEVLVEAIIVKVDENVLNQLGIVWGTPDASLDNPTGASNTGGTVTTAVTPSPNNTFALKATERGTFGFLPSGNLAALLHLLKSNGSSDVLSTPSVVVLNNQKAKISDGQNVGMANRSYQGTGAASSTTTTITSPYNVIQRQDVALSLEVTPHISPNHMIQLGLLQKDDSLASSSGGSTTNSDNPTVNTTSIKTSVLVKSGDILVLGGLIDNEQEKSKQKIPILGDIPLLGQLFRYDTHRMEKKNLMVFIRPIILSRHVAHEQTMHRYDYIRQQQIEMETEGIKLHKMPVLPYINRHVQPQLPRPVATMALPPPIHERE